MCSKISRLIYTDEYTVIGRSFFKGNCFYARFSLPTFATNFSSATHCQNENDEIRGVLLTFRKSEMNRTVESEEKCTSGKYWTCLTEYFAECVGDILKYLRSYYFFSDQKVTIFTVLKQMIFFSTS